MASRSGDAQVQAAGMPHILVECGAALDGGIRVLGQFGDYVVTPISGARAFRDYSWVSSLPAMNSTGNLRGMVLSKSFRTIWNVSTNVGEKLQLASIVIEFAKELSRMQQVWKSDTSVNEKGPRLLFMGSAAILRGVTSVVPEAVHLLALSAEGYLDIAGAASGSAKPLELATTLQSADQWVSSTFQAQWNGENWYTFATQHLTM